VKLRHIPPFLIGIAAAAGLGWTWLVYDELRQNQFIYTVIIGGGAAILLFLWTVATARWSWRRRVTAIVAAFVALALFPVLFRAEEVSGDLIPRFAWRWSRKADETLPQLGPSGSAASPRVARGGGIDLRTSTALDYPRFLGAEADAVAPAPLGSEPGWLARDWQAQPPRELWRQPIGAGWSSFAVVADYAVTQEQRGPDELVVCYEWRTGEIVWSHADPQRFDSAIAGIGPRATPTLHEGRVYAMGATALLNCLDGVNGKPVWTRDVLADLGGENNTWGTSCSPLVVGDTVIVWAGDAIAGWKTATGELAWRAPIQGASYASPLLRDIAGTPQIVVLEHLRISGRDPSSGAELWSHPWPGKHPKVTQPVVLEGDRVLVTSGYGIGAELLEIEATEAVGADGGRHTFAVKSLWKNNRLKSKFANVIARGDAAWGLDDGIMVAIDLTTGKRLWKRGRYGHGQILQVDGLLLVQAERGEVALVEPRTDQHVELTRFQALEGKTWNHAVVVGRHLLVRNSTEAACWELPLAARAER